ncbi:MAG: hypothetical protein PWQ57_461 [Desulfovibrionales bacterium]|jgi:hypothetical protein|nr:hypothetical protein [Desulfovibrionales bacterium]
MNKWCGVLAGLLLAVHLGSVDALAAGAKADLSAEFKAMHALYKDNAAFGRETQSLVRQCRDRNCQEPARDLELAYQTLRLIIAHVQDLSVLYQFADYDPKMLVQINQHLHRRMDGFVNETYRVQNMLDAAAKSDETRIRELSDYYADVLKQVKIQLEVLKVKFEP